MIKPITLVCVLLLIVSCNSNGKKNTDLADYSNKDTHIKTDPELKLSIARGQLIYNDLCITCHMAKGEGVINVFPPIAGSDYLKENQDKSIIGIKKGMTGEIVVNGIKYNSAMTPLGLSDDEVADVMNYINNSWGNNYGEIIRPQDVTNVIKKQG